MRCSAIACLPSRLPLWLLSKIGIILWRSYAFRARTLPRKKKKNGGDNIL